MTPEKPKYTEPCNHCGLCCSLVLCPIASVSFPGARAPCPALVTTDGAAKCGLVMAEQWFESEPILQKALGIGCGCSMPDASTSGAEMEAFDRRSFVKVYGRSPTPRSA